MKRSIVFALLAALAAVALPGKAAVAAATGVKPVNYDDFGFALLRQLAPQSKDENVFISPVSIGVALSMAAEGAKGSTRSAIVQGLGVPANGLAGGNAALIASLLSNRDATVGVANAIWTRADLPPLRPYVQTLEQKYDARAQALRFGDPSAAQAINAWTKDHTLGLIDRLVDRTNTYDFAYLTNALAFNGKWTEPFKKNATHPAPFTDASGSKHNVQMMNNTASYADFDGPNFRAVRVPYGHGGFAAYILLPADRTADAFANTLDAASFARIASNMHAERVALSVPRFTARYRASLTPSLKSLGMAIAFSKSAADFSVIHPMPPRLYIADVEHASYLRVDEEGTVAAAATSVEIGLTAVEVPPKTFVVDHPFVFAIRDEHSGSLLFLGVIRSVQ